jgi:hypothetical protein
MRHRVGLAARGTAGRPELLAAIDGDAEAQATLDAKWRAHLADCKYD